MTERSRGSRIALSIATFFAVSLAGLLVAAIYVPAGLVVMASSPVVAVAVFAGIGIENVESAAAAVR